MSDFSTYFITPEDEAKVDKWYDDIVSPASVKKQKKENRRPSATMRECWEMGHAYRGAIGGGIEYCFGPNGIGTTFVVRDSYTGLELNLTDYDCW